ncbi:unnamed protein product [Paramecium sonneborni]|uniref:Uncharacterized protein n=1 Tax=Paramecium sonneborni TaxID=65129 RepID=A0A8S1NY77_9CILI|nr:unnamed protein product [Paramecium sonneborni]
MLEWTQLGNLCMVQQKNKQKENYTEEMASKLLSKLLLLCTHKKLKKSNYKMKSIFLYYVLMYQIMN